MLKSIRRRFVDASLTTKGGLIVGILWFVAMASLLGFPFLILRVSFDPDDRTLLWYAGAVLLTTGAASLVAWRIFSSSITRRIGAIVSTAGRIERGERLDLPVSASDEIGVLAKSLHSIGAMLRVKQEENEMFIYSVSHDLRSPLVNLEGFSRELEFQLEEIRRVAARFEGSPQIDALVSEEVPTSLRYIRSAVGRLSTIIDSLLRLSRVGRLRFRPETLDLRRMIEKAVDSHQREILEHRATVSIEEMPPIVCDAAAVEQIFGSLISNALKYLRPGTPGVVEVGMDRVNGDDRGHCFFVRDNGVGIPPSHYDKVFVPFQRLHEELAEGEGVGLALSRRIVERLGGRLWFESHEDRGSTFYVFLPTLPGADDEIVTPRVLETAV